MAEALSRLAEIAPNSDTGMIGCPMCSTELEPWQIYCHSCGQSVSSFEIPVLNGELTFETDHMKAFRKWMQRGKNAFKDGSFDEAHACFAEALKRVHGLDGKHEYEIKARQRLADSFLKLNKSKEAIEQLVRAEQLSNNESQKHQFQKRIDYLNHKTSKASSGDPALCFRAPRERELLSVALYCASCRRLLSESEVYRVRSGKHTDAHCICGYNGLPVTTELLIAPGEPVPLGPPLGLKKAQLIEAAHKPVEGGRNKRTAIWLAVILGNFGIHKFYLGERVPGIVYGAMCWTFVPWLLSLYDALHMAQMSRVSFNLVYNIEQIVQRLPLDVERQPDEPMSMEVLDDPHDLVDAWSQGDEVIPVDV